MITIVVQCGVPQAGREREPVQPEAVGGAEIRAEALGGLFWNISFRLMALLGFLQKGWRWLLFLLLAPILTLVVPAICYLLDPLDRKRDYTLGYFCQARKP